MVNPDKVEHIPPPYMVSGSRLIHQLEIMQESSQTFGDALETGYEVFPLQPDVTVEGETEDQEVEFIPPNISQYIFHTNKAAMVEFVIQAAQQNKLADHQYVSTLPFDMYNRPDNDIDLLYTILGIFIDSWAEADTSLAAENPEAALPSTDIVIDRKKYDTLWQVTETTMMVLAANFLEGQQQVDLMVMFNELNDDLDHRVPNEPTLSLMFENSLRVVNQFLMDALTI